MLQCRTEIVAADIRGLHLVSGEAAQFTELIADRQRLREVPLQ